MCNIKQHSKVASLTAAAERQCLSGPRKTSFPGRPDTASSSSRNSKIKGVRWRYPAGFFFSRKGGVHSRFFLAIGHKTGRNRGEQRKRKEKKKTNRRRKAGNYLVSVDSSVLLRLKPGNKHRTKQKSKSYPGYGLRRSSGQLD